MRMDDPLSCTPFVFSNFYARKFIFCSVNFCRRVVFVKCFTLDVVLVRRCIPRFTVDQDYMFVSNYSFRRGTPFTY